MNHETPYSKMVSRVAGRTRWFVLAFIAAAWATCVFAGQEKAVARAGAGDLYAVVVGVSKYRDPRVQQLKVSDKDARDFAEFLNGQKGLFRKVHIALLVNEEATRTQVERELYYKLRRAKKDDTVIVFLSGHGADDPNTPGEFFFLTYDADPDYLAASALHMNRQWFLSKLDSKRVVLIADACHAGGFATQGLKALPPSMYKFAQLIRESEGRVFISSSRPDEYSRERPATGNSLFTYHMLQGLRGEADANKDEIITLSEMYEYVYDKVKEASNGYQSPQWDGSKVTGAFPMALASLQPIPAPITQPPSTPRPVARGEQPSAFSADIAGFSEKARDTLRKAEKGDLDAQEQLGDFYYYGREGVPKDFKAALKWFEKAAEKGRVYSQYCLGWMYRKGEGTATNYGAALKWYRKAAEQGYASAQKDLGLMYENHLGVSEDLKEAVKWYLKAAEQGDMWAQKYLGYMYDMGRGVPKDFKLAVMWYKRSAEKGCAPGQYNLGTMYESGTGVDKNYKIAMEWYRKAADQGHAAALYRVGLSYQKGLGVAADREQAITWYKKAVEKGDENAKKALAELESGADVSRPPSGTPEQGAVDDLKQLMAKAEQGDLGAQNDLGFRYERGQGVEKNLEKAVMWYRKAADAGYALAQNNLGIMYRNGAGVEKSDEEALKWFRKSAEQGHAGGQFNVGWMYGNGRGVPLNYEEAVKWYRKSAMQGHPTALYNLGYMYSEGKGVPKDLKIAAQWYLKSAEKGDLDAQYKIGWMYQQGVGVEENREEAIKWFKKAAEQGNAKAKEALQMMNM